MTAPVLDLPEAAPTTGDGTGPADCAHFVDQRPVERGGTGQDIAAAIIEGTEVVALCGYRFIPYREPQGRPVCDSCVAAFGEIK